MPDERPRPQYGEYATPEQQAAAMGKRPIPPLRVFPEIPSRAPTPTPPPNAEDRVRSVARPTKHPVDRIVTYSLLALGVFSLLDSIQPYLQFATTLTQIGHALGVAFSAPASAAQAGYLILGAHVVLLLGTGVLAVAFTRRGRIAFYLPILGYLVFELAVFAILAATTPTFFDVLSRYAVSLQ